MELENNLLDENEVYEDELISKVELLLSKYQENSEMLENLIKKQIDVKDSQIDKLYSELESYKKDSADRFVEQFMKSIIKVRKDLQKRINSDTWENMSKEDIQREYLYVFEDLTDLLEQQNIDSYATANGEMFNPALHQAKVEITDNIDLDKKIKCSISEGYRRGNKILIPERVIVYQYK